MDNVDPTQWKIYDINPDGTVAFDWHAIDKLHAAYALGVRGHLGTDFSHALFECRRQTVDGLINGSREQAEAIMNGSGVVASAATSH